MPDLLSAAQLTRLRKEFVLDFVEQRQEFGAAPTVTGTTAIGSTTLALSGLASGTITKGTRFQVCSGGYWRTYVATADATITSNAATVSISPSLALAAVAGDVVQPEKTYGSTYNRRTTRPYFEDAILQDLAQRAYEWKGAEISAAYDRDEAWFRVIQVLAFEQMLNDSSWRDITRADDTNNRAQDYFDFMDKTVKTMRESAGVPRTRITLTR